ncbi:MAG: SUMF1/EgtB/PvdO family nonheme iron enzyme [Thermodesulfobacteriota bacterium]|nr:SUMF1/EgtB/PvdO family nonheme iron enzyme [Thermodesulfobacteriota bacterium]
MEVVHPNFCSDIYCQQDLLGFDKYVDTLAGMIRDKGFSTPFCIGIYGRWGTGKTSFMHLLQNRLAEDGNPPHVVPVWFNPWRYEKEEHLIIPFLKTIEKSINSYVERQEATQKGKPKKAFLDLVSGLKTAAMKMGEVASAFAYGMKADCKIGPVGLELDLAKSVAREEALAEKRMERARKLSETLSSIYYDIVTELKNAVDQKDFLIAVFIDDLDRCLPEKAVELLEAIKLFLDLTGYLFVIGVAKDVVEKGISYRYRFYEQNREETDTEKEPVVAPEEYLEKMIQMPFELPPIERGKNLEYIKSLLGEAKEYTEHVGAIGTGVGANPRALKRFVNFLAFTSRLAETIKEAELEKSDLPSDVIRKGFLPVLYVKWAIIVFKFPEVHAEIKANRHLLIELQEEARGERKAEDKIERRLQMPDALRKVLREGVPFPDHDGLLKRFVYFTEATDIMVKEVEGARVTRTRSFEPGDMVKIPKGSFLYGHGKEERAIDYDYWIDVFPVTNKQYREFLSDPDFPDHRVPNRDEEWAKPYNWDPDKRTFPEGRGDHPVVLVSHEDAQAFCQWRSKKENKEYRLPTEEEWERAARGSDGREYPWGDEFDETKCNTKESGIGKTTSVTAYPEGASPHQCQNMAGNIWEWTSSYYDEDKDTMVLRGGSWDYDQDYARCAILANSFPDLRYNDIGFRCVRTSK